MASPEYNKPSHLYVSEHKGFVTGELTQQQGPSKQPIAYYSTELNKIEKGMPPCYLGLAPAEFAHQKTTSITIGHPVVLYTMHALHTFLTSPSFVITNAGRTGYDVILFVPELTV